MLAAYGAAMHGARVTVLEKKKRPGRKLMITGKGRCNLTNVGGRDQLLEQFPDHGKFLYGALSRFDDDDIRALLMVQGVETKVERGGRVFPASDRAVDVVDGLVESCRQLGVRFQTESPVVSMLLEGGRVTGVRTGNGAELFGRVVVATGGLSYPATGSDGDGYKLARQAGHRVTKLLPSLVSLKTKERWTHEMAGLALKNVRLTSYAAPDNPQTAFGEMLFTHEGISGPMVLTLSRNVVRALQTKSAVRMELDLKPALDEATLDRRLVRDFVASGRRDFDNYLKELVPKSMIEPVVALSGIEGHRKCHSLTRTERKTLGSLLKHLSIQVNGHGGFDEAVVTQGGVDLEDVNPATMESKRIRGLYFAGEILDLDAYTGGYNLQAAFSTGYLAGMSAALEGEK